MNIDLRNPEVQRVLKRIKTQNRSDPFAVKRVVTHLLCGVLRLEDLKPKGEKS